MAGITEARRKIAAIDKRIDAVRAELLRRVAPFDQMSAGAWQRAWDSIPGLQGIEGTLFARRGRMQAIRDAAEEKEWLAAKRRAANAFRKQADAKRYTCAACGQIAFAA